MSLYSISDAQLAFGHVALLDHADFSLEAGERVGLIGRNGAGKSSLLKIVAGLTKPDDGLVTRQSELSTVYVPQEPEFDTGRVGVRRRRRPASPMRARCSTNTTRSRTSSPTRPKAPSTTRCSRA